MIDENGLKQCTKCDEWKPLARFYQNVNYRDGYRNQCKDCMIEAAKQWDKEHSAPKPVKQPKDYATYRKERLLRARKWRQANPEKTRLRSLITSAHYNARKNGAEGTFTAREWLGLCDYYGNKCLACGEEKPLTIDHIVPTSGGGSNYISNIQPLCLGCNSKKHTQTTDYRPTVPAWVNGSINGI